MGYAERRVAPDVVAWSSTGARGTTRVLPDGCLDLLFDGHRLVVAGPDTAARLHHSEVAQPLWAVRLHSGRGPQLLGVPASDLADRTVPLADLWGERRARELTGRVSIDPVRELAQWAVDGDPDPLGARLRSELGGGAGVTQVADTLGLSTRQLNRRCRSLFGYGPAHLARILRLMRAITAADRGASWAEASAVVGYFDQSHLTRDVRELAGTTPGALRRERVRSVQDGNAQPA